ncbi:hypothetical protein LCGC14_2678350 [marine sediment metagenome]|uniref:HD domain-containing protein n=1 Tax=marine sediment metagenome TaxID=412755 RepID=A0A0F9A9Q3_9ZZZZ
MKKAEQIATEAHKGQFRYDKKTPFIEHPRAVAESFNDPDRKIIAWLHDVAEDTDVSLDDLAHMGFRMHIISALKVLTKDKNETYLNYLLRVKQNELAKDVKLADLEHNKSTSPGRHQQDKYALAQYILRESSLLKALQKIERIYIAGGEPSKGDLFTLIQAMKATARLAIGGKNEER